MVFSYTKPSETYILFTCIMLKNILLILAILLPSVLYLYIVTKDDAPNPPSEMNQNQ